MGFKLCVSFVGGQGFDYFDLFKMGHQISFARRWVEYFDTFPNVVLFFDLFVLFFYCIIRSGKFCLPKTRVMFTKPIRSHNKNYNTVDTDLKWPSSVQLTLGAVASWAVVALIRGSVVDNSIVLIEYNIAFYPI